MEYFNIRDARNKLRKNNFLTQDERTKKYIVFDNLDKYLHTKHQVIKNGVSPYWHEVILENKPRKFFMDIDFAVDEYSNEHKEYYDRHVKIASSLLIREFNNLFPTCKVDSSELRFVNSSGISKNKYKFSCNIVLGSYAFPDQETFRVLGLKIHKKFVKLTKNETFIDKAQLNKHGLFANRLVNCTKYNDGIPENRFKRYEGDEKDVIITYVDGLPVVPGIKKKNISFRSNLNYVGDKNIKLICDATKEYWDGVFDFWKVKGNIILFKRLCSYYCTLCDRVHDNDNTFHIYMTETYVIPKCWKCNDRIFDLIYLESILPTQVKPEEIKPKQLPPVKKYKYELTETNECISEHAFSDARIELIKANMKMGKTKAVIKMLEKNGYLTDESRIIIPSFRRTYSAETNAKFNNFSLYSNINENSIDLNTYPKLIIQIESLHRINTMKSIRKDGSSCDILILDEIESIWDQFNSGNFIDYLGAVNTFKWLISGSIKIIIMDAFLDSRTEILFSKLIDNFEKHTNKYTNLYNPSKDIKYIMCESDKWLSLLSKKARSNNIAIFTNSINEANNIYTYLSDYSQVKKENMMIYSSETLESVKRTHFSDVNKYWSSYKIIICTPTISAGVSFELNHFDYIFGLFTNMSCNVETCMQMMGRVRNVKKKEIYLDLRQPQVNGVSYLTSISDIEEGLKYRRQEVVIETKNDTVNHLDFKINPMGVMEYKETFLYWLTIYNIRHNNYSKKYFIHKFEKILKGMGHELISPPNIKMETLIKDKSDFSKSKNKYKNFINNNIINSKLIEKEDYKKIKDKRRNMEDVSEEEIYETKKYKLINILEIDELNHKIINYFTPANLQKVIETRKIFSFDNWEWDNVLERMKEMESKFIMDKNVNIIDYNKIKYKYYKHYLFKKILYSYGINEDLKTLFIQRTEIESTPANRSDFEMYSNQFLKSLHLESTQDPLEKLKFIIGKLYTLRVRNYEGIPHIVAETFIVIVDGDKRYYSGKLISANKNLDLPSIYLPLDIN